jgi:hypothetical protein
MKKKEPACVLHNVEANISSIMSSMCAGVNRKIYMRKQNQYVGPRLLWMEMLRDDEGVQIVRYWWKPAELTEAEFRILRREIRKLIVIFSF